MHPPTDDWALGTARAPSSATFAALCLQCGAGRRLALARCETCGHLPTDDRDRAAHLLAMDLDAAARRALAERVTAGGGFDPDPDELKATVDALGAATPLAVASFALLVGGVPFLLVVVALGLLAWGMLAL